MPDSADQMAMNRTYPTGHAVKPPPLLLPSRIPVASKRKEQNSGRQDTKALQLPPVDRRQHTNHYAHSGKPPPPPANGKKRDSSAKYKLRLAEKDQKILETHEFIQVCDNADKV